MAKNTTNSMDELLYLYKDSGQNLQLIALSGAKFAFSLVSQVFCASLLYVTWRSKHLRDSYNILIAANCLSNFLFMFTFAVQFTIYVTGLNFIPISKCFFLMIVPIFFVQCQYLLYLALALDRLMTVIFPFWHIKNIQQSTTSTWMYLASIFGTIAVYGAFCVYTGIDYSLVQNPQRLVSCSTPDSVPEFVFRFAIYINFGSLIAYILLCVVIRKKKSSAASFSATRKIMKSTLAAFLLEFFGWFSNILLRNILGWLQVPFLQQWWIMGVAGIVLMLIPMLALYAPVLYIMSSEYGKAFKHSFGWHFPLSAYNNNLKSSIAAVTVHVKEIRVRSFDSKKQRFTPVI